MINYKIETGELSGSTHILFIPNLILDDGIG